MFKEVFKEGEYLVLKESARERIMRSKNILDRDPFLLGRTIFIYNRGMLDGARKYYDMNDFREATPIDIAKYRLKNEQRRT